LTFYKLGLKGEVRTKLTGSGRGNETMLKRFNLGNIRALLSEGFTDQQLRVLCYDEPAFRQVYDQLESKTGKTEIIQRLIEHADRQSKLKALLAWAKEHNPTAYKNHQPYEVTISTTSGDVSGKPQRAKYSSPKYDSKKLAILVELRREAGLSQHKVAEFFGMERGDSVRAWEVGTSAPHSTRRSQFIVYLLDKLGLRHNYQKFLEVWNKLIVGEWEWEPLNANELGNSFPGTVTPLAPQHITRVPLQRPPRVPHFIGRKDELKQLLTDLQPGQVVTLCGPGGIGKSALAAEAIKTLASGDDLTKRFPDGIVWHDFYIDSQVDIALDKIVRAFGEEPKPTPVAAAQRVLAGRRMLLLLDGVENADDLRKILIIRGQCGVLNRNQNENISFVLR
jgi:hypothetical protein